MKKLLAIAFLFPSLLFGAAANDLLLQQRNAGNTSYVERLVPLDAAVTSGSLTSFRSALGIGTEDSPAFTNQSLTGYLSLAEQSAPSTPTNASRFFVDSSNRFSWIGENGFVRTFDGTANTANRVYALPDAAGTVLLDSRAVIPSTNTSGLQLYNTADQTNYERLEVKWSSDTAIIQTALGGSGGGRPIRINAVGAGSNVWSLRMSSGTTPRMAFGLYSTPTSTTRANTTGLSILSLAEFTGSASTGTQVAVTIDPTWNQTSTAGATDLLINRTQTAVGSGTQRLIDAQVGGVTQFNVSNVGDVAFTGTATGLFATGIGSPTSDRPIDTRRNANSIAQWLIANATSGTGAGAGVTISNNTTSTNDSLFLRVYSGGFTTSGLAIADGAAVVAGSNLSAGLVVGTGAATPLIFGVNNAEAARFDGTLGNFNVASTTTTPAGGSTSARLLMGTTAGFGIYYGSGLPTVSAAQGSIYLRSDGSSTSTRMYINTDGGTTWTNVTTAL